MLVTGEKEMKEGSGRLEGEGMKGRLEKGPAGGEEVDENLLDLYVSLWLS